MNLNKWYLVILLEKDLVKTNAHLRIHWRLSIFLKASKKLYEVIFFDYVKVCIFWKSIQYTTDWDKKQMLQKTSFRQNKRYKDAPFFFAELQLIIVLLLICDCYMSWSISFICLKLCVGFSIFASGFCLY